MIEIDTLDDGGFKEKINDFFKKEVRLKIFTPTNIMNKADSMLNACLGLQAIKALGELEDKEKYERGIMPSASSCSEYTTNLSTGAAEILSPKITFAKEVTCYSIPLELVLKEIIKSANLLYRGRTKEEIEAGNFPEPIATDGTIDGGKLTEHKGMIIYGIKLIDRELIIKLFHELSEEEKVGDEYFAGVHSPDAILILGIAQVNISTEIKLK